MEQAQIAKVAVAAATYSIDKPYDYLIPEPLDGKALRRYHMLTAEDILMQNGGAGA